jgi:hypothetical protein
MLGAVGQVPSASLAYGFSPLKEGRTGTAVDEKENCLREEVQFWLRLSGDLLEAPDEASRRRALLALTDAIKRLLGHDRTRTH